MQKCFAFKWSRYSQATENSSARFTSYKNATKSWCKFILWLIVLIQVVCVCEEQHHSNMDISYFLGVTMLEWSTGCITVSAWVNLTKPLWTNHKLSLLSYNMVVLISVPNLQLQFLISKTVLSTLVPVCVLFQYLYKEKV